MTVPRILTVMGSGETAPTMIKVHRRIMEAVGATSSRHRSAPQGLRGRSLARTDAGDELLVEVLAGACPGSGDHPGATIHGSGSA